MTLKKIIGLQYGDEGKERLASYEEDAIVKNSEEAKGNEKIGVIKTYTSKLGDGVLLTELDNEIGNLIRESGHEYDETTGEPRRIGWLDLVMIKQKIKDNGITSLCVNHLDTIGKLEKIKICIIYYYNHKSISSYVPVDIENCRPIYKSISGTWNIKSNVTLFEDLPLAAREFIEFIEDEVGIPVKYVGFGDRIIMK